MRRSEKRLASRGGGRVRAWLSRNREALAVSILGGLLALALPATVSLLLDAGTAVVIAVAALSAAGVAFVAGALYARDSKRGEDGVREIERLTHYMDYFANASQRLQLGQLEELELELLSWPAGLIERETGGTVQLAIFVPVEAKDRDPYWHLSYVARISPSECRELAVPIQGSQLARSQESWEPGDEVMVIPDLQERRWRKLGTDFEAFAQAGFRMVRYLPFGPPGPDGMRACIVLLSKDSETGFTGAEDFFIKLLGTLLSMHPLLSK